MKLDDKREKKREKGSKQKYSLLKNILWKLEEIKNVYYIRIFGKLEFIILE